MYRNISWVLVTQEDHSGVCILVSTIIMVRLPVQIELKTLIVPPFNNLPYICVPSDLKINVLSMKTKCKHVHCSNGSTWHITNLSPVVTWHLKLLT